MAQQFVTAGDVITTEAGLLAGHGTQQTEDKKLLATLSGIVERTNKLVSVRPLSARYSPEVGDVVVGRITEVGDKRWKVDIGARQDAILMLSAVNLPGGVQRRRTHEDSLAMRTFFAENDLISAEVQKVMQDGAVALHTRNLKYGKLQGGTLVQVPASLIKRSKQHFHSLPMGVDVILGTNGFVWVYPTPTSAPADGKTAEETPAPTVVDAVTRERVARVRNCVVALSRAWLPIYRETVLDVYLQSTQLGLLAKDVLAPDNLQRVTQTAAARRDKTVAQQAMAVGAVTGTVGSLVDAPDFYSYGSIGATVVQGLPV